MRALLRGVLAGLALVAVLPLAAQETAPVVRFKTNLGDIDVQLLPGAAPKTVQNFLGYVRRGDFKGTIFHRSVPGFIIQGGGFRFANGQLIEIPQQPAVVNEFSVSNTRGTLAMAKLGSDPNSATNQWFFNLANNGSNLDQQNGGFTVFGRVMDSAGLGVMDRIASVPVPTPGPLASPFDSIPLINYYGGNVTSDNLVGVISIEELEPIALPTIAENGVLSATNFGGYAAAAPGSYVEIYGKGLAGETPRVWADSDFIGGNAPTTLGGVRVTVGGRSAYINYVSANQINVQLPSTLPTGGPLPVVVTYQGQASVAVDLEIRTAAGGLLAPAAFQSDGKQFAAAVHAASGALVSNGKVAGIGKAPVVPGEVLTFYGTGFGPVVPSSTALAGRKAPSSPLATLATPVEFRIGGTVANVNFAGLAPALVGVYQFNVTVPASAPSGDLPLEVTLGGERIGQTLYLPVEAK